MIKFTLQTDLRAGPGASSLAAQYARDHRANRVSVVIDAGLRDNERAQALTDELNGAADLVQLLENDVAEPDYDYLDEFRKLPEPNLDLIIGIGGGSTLDLAKAVSVLLTNPAPAISYRGFELIEQPGVPIIAIPTTAGTGSEVTPNAVFTDRKEQRKLGINTAKYLPKLALLDPLLVTSCPRSVAVSAGLDALVHSVESYVAKAATPISRTYSREAFRLITAHLPTVAERPDDVEAVFQMQLGAFYAGAALMNSGAGPAGALSYPLGVLWSVPHGTAGGFFIGPVAEWNLERGADAYDDLVPGEASAAVVATIRRVSEAVDVPSSLSAFGVGHDDISKYVEQTFMLEGALLMNPVPVTRDDLHALLTGLC